MQRIALTKSVPGMVLAQAVSRRNGGPVLVGEGITLTETIIGAIREEGIGTIWVEGTPLGPQGTVGSLRVVAERLPFLFRRHEKNMFMMTLRAVLSRRLAKRIAEQRVLEDAAIGVGKNSGNGENAAASTRSAK